MLTKEMYDIINSYNKARVCIEKACIVLYKDYQTGCDTYTDMSDDEINGLIADAFKSIVSVEDIEKVRVIILDIFWVVITQPAIEELNADGIFDYIFDAITNTKVV